MGIEYIYCTKPQTSRPMLWDFSLKLVRDWIAYWPKSKFLTERTNTQYGSNYKIETKYIANLELVKKTSIGAKEKKVKNDKLQIYSSYR